VVVVSKKLLFNFTILSDTSTEWLMVTKKNENCFFIYGNRIKKPAHALKNSKKRIIIDLYRTKYEGTNLTHFSELLEEFEARTFSQSTIRSILIQEFILSLKAKRASKKALSAKLNKMKKSTKSKKETNIIQSSILAIEDAHPRLT